MVSRKWKRTPICLWGATVIGLSSFVQHANAQDSAPRPVVTVRDFDFGTVASQVAADKRTRKQLSKMGIRDSDAFVAALGVGAADLVVEKLVALGQFRVVERKNLSSIELERSINTRTDSATAPNDGIAAVPVSSLLRARYIISGSVTRLGFEDKQLGGAVGTLATRAFLYGLSAKRQKTAVHLTARVIDAETGEIVASYTGEGESSKGWKLSFGGMGSWGFGGGSQGVTNIRETSIGEATERAASNLAELIARGRPQMIAVAPLH